ncbi:uncharacterized protein An09g03220 [Aspergillus niger]|uniref:Contig An09c0080, genomic contig n=2 Tax=Aspergillus niger TaxID=5061 RepID=A2QTT6_ASPNC|nr:uncharacterized protein An09g03220 [Aspergillus niger]CAK40261.1 unnamed protein product [Aspergillus niger]
MGHISGGGSDALVATTSYPDARWQPAKSGYHTHRYGRLMAVCKTREDWAKWEEVSSGTIRTVNDRCLKGRRIAAGFPPTGQFWTASPLVIKVVYTGRPLVFEMPANTMGAGSNPGGLVDVLGRQPAYAPVNQAWVDGFGDGPRAIGRAPDPVVAATDFCRFNGPYCSFRSKSSKLPLQAVYKSAPHSDVRINTDMSTSAMRHSQLKVFLNFSLE